MNWVYKTSLELSYLMLTVSDRPMSNPVLGRRHSVPTNLILVKVEDGNQLTA